MSLDTEPQLRGVGSSLQADDSRPKALLLVVGEIVGADNVEGPWRLVVCK